MGRRRTNRKITRQNNRSSRKALTTSRKNFALSGKLDFEKVEDRNLLSASPGIELGGELGNLQQQLILDHLSDQADTSYLLEGANNLQLIGVENGTDNTTAIFQHMLDGLPIVGRHVSVVQASHGEILSVENRAGGFLTTTDNMTPTWSSQLAQQTANQHYADRSDLVSDASLAWFKLGNQVELAWQVTTTVPGANVNGLDLEYFTTIDANSGDLLSQSQSPSIVDDLVSENNIHPRIVINDTIGPAGSQAYAATFGSVVDIGGGCTGTLVAPNVVIGARHCGSGAGTVINFGTDSNAPDFSFTVQSAQLPAGPGSLLDGGDVEILILDTDVPDTVATPMRFIDRTTELVGEAAATVGYGLNGVGSTGHQGSSDGLRWGGENVIDAYGVPAGGPAGANIISTDFDDGSAGANGIPGSDPTPLEFEASTAPGDSGGPILIDVGGEWAISGVLSGGNSATSQYGDLSWWTGTAIYRTQIEAVGGEFVTFGEIEVSVDDEELLDGGQVDFGVTNLGGTITKTITVTNDHLTGDLELFEPISVPSEFSVSQSFGATTLAPGESTTFEIRFDSNPFGTYVGEVSFESGDADENPFNFTVTATVSPPIGEADSVLVDRRWKTVFLRNTYVDPVVVIGPATFNEADPVTVRVRNVTADSFQVKIHEWQYLDRAHVTEQVSYVVMESGTHRLADGTLLIAQNTDGISTEFADVAFELPFDSTPVVLTQTTTVNGGSPVVTRLDNVSTTGFEVMLQEEQFADQTHTPETVSWFAFLPSEDDLGVLNQRSAIEVRHVNHDPTALNFSDSGFEDPPVFLAGMQSFFGSNTAGLRLTNLTNSSATVFVEEEQSLNEETNHGKETIGFLALEEGDIIGTTIVAESGHISGVGRAWQTVNLQHNFVDPVVLLSSNTFNESDPGVVRARNVTGNSFQVHFEEWNYLDLNHAGETVSYIVFESGIHRLRDGTVFEARNSLIDANFETVTFMSNPEETPVVLSQVASANGPSTITTRMKDINTIGFDIRVQEEEASATQPHVNELVSWVAIQPSGGDIDGIFYEAKVAGDSVNHKGETIFFTNFFDDPPAVITSMQTYVGDNTSIVRQTETTSAKIEVFIEEEQSLDTETGHGFEDVGYFAISTGLIDGYLLDLVATPGGGGVFGGPPRSVARNLTPVTTDSGSGSSAIQEMILSRDQFEQANDSAFQQLEDSPLSYVDVSDSDDHGTLQYDHYTSDANNEFVDRKESNEDSGDSYEWSNDLETELND